MASGSLDGSVKVWDLDTVSLMHTLDEHFGSVEVIVELDPEVSLLASGGYDSRVKVWNYVSGELVFDLVGHDNTIVTLAYIDEGNLLASGGYDAKIIVWNLNDKGVFNGFD